MTDKEKDPANMGGIGRVGRPPPRRHRDTETALDWTNRAELWSYMTERNGDGALPTTIRDNVKPEVLQRMATRCALEEMRERVEGKNDQIDRQNDIIEHYQKQVRQLQALIYNAQAALVDKEDMTWTSERKEMAATSTEDTKRRRLTEGLRRRQRTAHSRDRKGVDERETGLL